MRARYSTSTKCCLYYTSLLLFVIVYASPTFSAGAASDDVFEMVPEGEDVQITDIARKTAELQRRRAELLEDQNSKVLRGVHPKSHGCVVAEFTINTEIPTEYQTGLFATPGKSYSALIRYSNAAVDLGGDLDGGNGSRGMAIKVFDVEGDVLISDEGHKNQDFLMINTQRFAFPNVQSYLRLTNALLISPDGTDPNSAFLQCSDWTPQDIANKNRSLDVITEIKKTSMSNPLEAQYFAAAPSRFGDGKAMKFSVLPCEGARRAQIIREDQKGDPNYLHTALAKTMRDDQDICLGFSVQIATADLINKLRMESPDDPDPIEDATAEWKQPYIELAKLKISTPQNIDPKEKVQVACNEHSFNPWHSLQAHQPLGGINRLRKPVYTISDLTRHSAE